MKPQLPIFHARAPDAELSKTAHGDDDFLVSGSAAKDKPEKEPSVTSTNESGGPGRWLKIEQASTPQDSGPSDVAAEVGTSPTPFQVNDGEQAWPLTLDEIIKRTVLRSLRDTNGNRRRAASMLGVSRSTLYRMLSRYGLDGFGRKTGGSLPSPNPRAPR